MITLFKLEMDEFNFNSYDIAIPQNTSLQKMWAIRQIMNVHLGCTLYVYKFA